jgi:peptidylprolyl isomerase
LKRFAAVLALLTMAACGGDGGTTTSPSAGGGTLVVEDLVVGTGATAASGDTVTVHYLGTFTNGTKFDSSYDRGTPYSFLLGAGRVIAGFDQGVTGMKVGGKRRLTIPPSLAYGNSPPQGIPANATLVFEVDLLSIAGK